LVFYLFCLILNFIRKEHTHLQVFVCKTFETTMVYPKVSGLTGWLAEARTANGTALCH